MAMLVYQRVSPNFSLNSPTWFCCFNRPGIAHLSIPRFGPCRKVMSRTSKPPAKSSLFLWKPGAVGTKHGAMLAFWDIYIYGIYAIYIYIYGIVIGFYIYWGSPILGNLSLHRPCWSAARPQRPQRPQWPGVTISKASDRSVLGDPAGKILWSMAIGGYTYTYKYIYMYLYIYMYVCIYVM